MNDLYLTSTGADVMLRATWEAAAPRQPETPSDVLAALSSDPALAEALADHAAAVGDVTDLQASAFDLLDTLEDATYAWRLAATSGAAKLPPAPDVATTAARLLGLHVRLAAASKRTIGTARAVDAAAPGAALNSSARATAYAALVEAADVARVKVAEAEAAVEASRSTFALVGVIDGLALQALGRDSRDVPHLLGDRLAQRAHRFVTGGGGSAESLQDRIPLAEDVATLAVPAAEAIPAAERRANAERVAASRVVGTWIPTPPTDAS